MTMPHYARLASKILKDAACDEQSVPPPAMEARARAVHAIEQAIVVRNDQRRRSRWLVAAAAAAAIVLLGGGAAKLVVDLRAPVAIAEVAASDVASPLLAMSPVIRETANVVLVGAGAPDTQAVDGTPIAHGKRLIARPLGHATLAFASGTELSLEERGDLTIDENGASQRFTLGAGAVNARVAKLAAGQTLVIATPDAQVEVRGTTFRVAVVPADPACGDGTTTRVDVIEGVVVVRARGVDTRVTAGERWPRGCTAPSAPASLAAIDAKRTPAPPTAALASASPSTASPSSMLSEQNDLFAEAVAAKRRGATAQAIATFERFLAKYPSSPLAESAMAERMRLLRGGDRTRALEAARAYLAHFPNGFARADAQAILAEAP